MATTLNESHPSPRQVYTLAHTAQCKLGMTGRDADRNLRFVLGHAFLLDQTLLRVAAIEGLDNTDLSKPETAKSALANTDDASTSATEKEREREPGQTGSLAGGKVKFDDGDSEDERERARKKARGQNERDAGVELPLPSSVPRPEDVMHGLGDEDHGPALLVDEVDVQDEAARKAAQDEEEGGGGGGMEEKIAFTEEELDGSGDDDDGLGLTRFESAAMQPPRERSPSPPPGMVADKGEDGEGEGGESYEPDSPPSLPADFDVHAIIDGPPDRELGDLYELVRCCPCHGRDGEKNKGIWYVDTEKDGGDGEIKGDGKGRKRLAIMRVES